MGQTGSRLVAAVAASAIFALGGCATPTPYRPYGMGGGYKDRPVGENRYYVEFYGNGHTNRDTVFAFWLHRCAELTLQKGFDYFALVSKTPPPAQSMLAPEDASYRASSDGDGGLLRVKGGGGGTTYVYVPGGTVTTWSTRGVIELKSGDAEADERLTFVARDVLARLGPAVQQATASGKNIVLPKEYIEQARPAAAPGGDAQGVKLDDLDSLLPKK